MEPTLTRPDARMSFESRTISTRSLDPHQRLPVGLTLILGIVLGLGLIVGASGCESSSGSMRATTFPPDLTYMPPEQIRTSMWVLAAEIQRLEQLLEEPTESERRSLPSEVSASLSRMRVAARALDKPGRSTQHPILNQHLGQFLERLDRARLAVDRDPPEYYLASSIAGSCFLCHGQTQGRASWQPDGR